MKWWGSVLAMELRKILAYRSDFWVTFIGQTLILPVIATALWTSIYETRGVSELKGFTLPMMTLYYLCIPLSMKIMSGSNVGFISREIYDGSFNRYLIYPLSFFTFKSLTYFTYTLFYALQLVIIYVLFHLWTGESLSFTSFLNLSLGVYLLLLCSGVYMGISMAVELCALWADNTWSLMVIVRFIVNFLGGGFIPLTFFPEWSQKILIFTPFPYLLDLPVRTIMGRTSTQEILYGTLILLFWIVVTHGLARLVWRAGEKNYTGVGI